MGIHIRVYIQLHSRVIPEFLKEILKIKVTVEVKIEKSSLLI